jgi:hypothetical protein
MLSPNIAYRALNQHVSPFSVRDLGWPGVAFGIAALTTALYCFFLDNAGVSKNKLN